MVKRRTRLSTEAARRAELERETEVGGPDFLSVEIESQTRLLVSVVRTRIVTVLIIFVARFGRHSFDVLFAEL